MYPDGSEDWRALIRRWRGARSGIRGPMSLSELARHAAALADAVVARIESSSRETGPSIACAKGCAACCREVIPVSRAEAERLADQMEGLPWDRRAEIGEGFRRGLAALESAGLASAPLLDRSEAYFALRIPCPFLTGEACSIHPARPLACREHLAASCPASCWDYPSPFIRPVELPFSVAEALAGICGGEWMPLIRMREWDGETGRAPESDGDVLLDRLARACESRLA